MMRNVQKQSHCYWTKVRSMVLKVCLFEYLIVLAFKWFINSIHIKVRSDLLFFATKVHILYVSNNFTKQSKLHNLNCCFVSIVIETGLMVLEKMLTVSCFYLHLKKGVALHVDKVDFSSSMVALSKISLIFV